MISLPLVEFYITNVCNLSCRGCNRYNNYNFKGHQLWTDYASEIEAWSKRLDIAQISIIGGEPTLNPDLESWASNLRRLWPNSDIMIQSNGTYPRPHFSHFWDKYHVGFVISLHDLTTSEDIIGEWNRVVGEHGVFLKGFVFHQPAVIENNNSFILHDSDTQHAFDCCDMKHDHTIHRGKLYKCPAVSILPEFNAQFKLDISSEQQELLHSYRPLGSMCSEEQLVKFFQDRDTAIDQCKFCPAHLNWHMALGEQIEPIVPVEFNIVHLPEIKLLKRLTQTNK